MRVRFLNGEARDFTSVETVDDLRRAVAEALSVEEEQVVLADGHCVLRANIRLQQLPIDEELSACVRRSWYPMSFELQQLLRPDRAPRCCVRFHHVRSAVQLPPNEDRRRWLCGRLLACYRDVTDVAKALEPCCTRKSCPRMRAGKHTTYRWSEPGDKMPPRELSAPDYFAALLGLAHRTFGGTGFSPEEVGQPLTADWMDSVQMLARRFLRIYAHAYAHHAEDLTKAGQDKHLNFHFQHFLFFVREFDLVGSSDLLPIRKIVKYFEELPVDKLPFHA